MGFTPAQVNEMSMWQWFAALHGFIDAHTPKEANKLTPSEADELFDWIERDAGPAGTVSTQTYWLEGEHIVPAGIVTFEV